MATRETSAPCSGNPLLSVLDTAPATDRLDQLEQQLPILPAELAPALPTPASDDGPAGPEGAGRGPAPTYLAPLADPLTMPIMPIRDRGVFVDDSGRRKLWMRTAGWVAAALSAAYVGVLGVTAISTAIGPQNTPAPAPALAPPTTAPAATPPPTSVAPSPTVKVAPPKPVVKPAVPPVVSVAPTPPPPATSKPPPATSKPPTSTTKPSTTTTKPSTTTTSNPIPGP